MAVRTSGQLLKKINELKSKAQLDLELYRVQRLFLHRDFDLMQLVARKI
jgi:hypothetical protein